MSTTHDWNRGLVRSRNMKIKLSQSQWEAMMQAVSQCRNCGKSFRLTDMVQAGNGSYCKNCAKLLDIQTPEIEASNKKKIKISKKQWEKIGKRAGWMKTATKYEVINSDFNKANYPDLIGKILDSPPAYAQVKVIQEPKIDDK